MMVVVVVVGSLRRCIVLVALRILRERHSVAMAAPLLLTSGPARCEAALHGFGIRLVCLFYAGLFVLRR